MPRLITSITSASETRYTLDPLYFSTSESALEAIIANPIRVIGVGAAVFGAEMGATMAPSVETVNYHCEIGFYGSKYGGLLAMKIIAIGQANTGIIHVHTDGFR